MSLAQLVWANTRALHPLTQYSQLSDKQVTYLLLSNSVKGFQLKFLNTLLQDICCVNFCTMLCLCKKQTRDNSIPTSKSTIQVYTGQNTYKPLIYWSDLREAKIQKVKFQIVFQISIPEAVLSSFRHKVKLFQAR